jgi:co-chaperonin GroES (HSP10)
MKHAFEPHQIKEIKALHDNILVSDMEFDARITTGGIIIPNDNGTGKGIRPRWGQVYAIGSKQSVVQIGQWILVAHGRWTRGIDIEDTLGPKTIRKVDPKDILMVSNDKPQDETFSDAVHIDKKSF